jgi:hypothetical protein
MDMTGIGFWARLWKMVRYKRLWLMEEPLILYVPWLNRTFFIPKGYVLDFASIPKWFWPILSPTGFMLLGSIPHDFGFQYGGLIEIVDGQILEFNEWTKHELDTLLLDITKCVARSAIPGNLAGIGLFAGSWVPWKKYRKQGQDVYADYPQFLTRTDTSEMIYA